MSKLILVTLSKAPRNTETSRPSSTVVLFGGAISIALPSSLASEVDDAPII
jgi:hypothetical protein